MAAETTNNLLERLPFRRHPTRRADARHPCIWKLVPNQVADAVLRGTGGRRSLARRATPVHPQVSTVGELWDRRRCHTRPDSRSIANRMRKGGYRGEDHLWSRRFV